MLDENGYEALDYNDALELVQSIIRNVRGETTNVSSRSFYGTLSMALAQLLVDNDEKGETAYDAGSINYASGVQLDELASNYGLMRKQATMAQVTLSFTGTVGYVIPTGTTFTDDNGNEFYTVDDLQLDANGTGSTLAVSNDLGEDYNVAAGTIINQQQPVEEIDTVTNAEAAAGGQDMETDLDFRARIKLASQASESSTLNGLYTALNNVTGVTSVKIIQNTSTVADSDGNPAKTIHFYVYGGTDEDVATAIFDNLGAGIATYGTLNQTVADSAGVSHTVYFDRPVETPIYAQVTTTVDSSFDQDSGTDDIKLAVSGYIESLTMGSKIAISQFFASLYAIDGLEYADVQIGLSADALSSTDIQLSTFDLPAIDDANIEVVYNG